MLSFPKVWFPPWCCFNTKKFLSIDHQYTFCSFTFSSRIMPVFTPTYSIITLAPTFDCICFKDVDKFEIDWLSNFFFSLHLSLFIMVYPHLLCMFLIRKYHHLKTKTSQSVHIVVIFELHVLHCITPFILPPCLYI